MVSLPSPVGESLDSMREVKPVFLCTLQTQSGTFDLSLQHRTTTELKVHSAWVYWGGFKWRLRVFPRGNIVESHISIYLQCGGPYNPLPTLAGAALTAEATQKSQEVPPAPIASTAWKFPGHVWIHVLPADRTSLGGVTLVKDAIHTFTEKESDWGFREFCPLTTIERKGVCDKEGSFTIRAQIAAQGGALSAHVLSAVPQQMEMVEKGSATEKECAIAKDQSGECQAEPLEELKASASKADVLAAMNNDELSRTVAAAMIRFEVDLQMLLPELTRCLRKAFGSLNIAGDVIVEFPQADLLGMILGGLKEGETYSATFGEATKRIFEWRLERFLHHLRL